MEKSCMKDDICHLDHRQRSLWGTISIGYKELIGVLQWTSTSWKIRSTVTWRSTSIWFFHANPLPKPIEDRTGQLVTQEIVGKSQREISSSDRTGQLVKEEEKPVLKSPDRTGQLVEGRLQKVQEDGHLRNLDDADKNLAMDVTRTLISTFPVCQMRWWNDRKALALITWFRKSKVILNEKQFWMISNSIVRSIFSAKRPKMRLWLLGILNYAR